VIAGENLAGGQLELLAVNALISLQAVLDGGVLESGAKLGNEGFGSHEKSVRREGIIMCKVGEEIFGGWGVGFQLSAISYQLSAVSYQLSAISYQLSAVGCQLSAVGWVRWVWGLGCGVWGVGWGAGCGVVFEKWGFLGEKRVYLLEKRGKRG
jgi:hypothetical protein